MNSSLTNPPRSTNSSYLSQSSKRAIAEPRDLNDSIQHEISYLNDETDATNSSFQSKTRPSQHLIKPINNTFLIAVLFHLNTLLKHFSLKIKSYYFNRFEIICSILKFSIIKSKHFS